MNKSKGMIYFQECKTADFRENSEQIMKDFNLKEV